MNLIIETDIGRDPDDFAAIAWLITAGVNVRAILISPGDPDQVAVAKYLLKNCGVENCLVGVPNLQRDKGSSGGRHIWMLEKDRFPTRMQADGLGVDIIREVLSTHHDVSFFACGPMDSIGRFVMEGGVVEHITIQGGFAGYEIYSPKTRIRAFEGKTHIPTFNLNGNLGAAQVITGDSKIRRRLVGKNVCHTILLTDIHQRQIESIPDVNLARAMLRASLSLCLRSGLRTFKKFHDPVAAVCHLHPEIGTWIKGRPELIRKPAPLGPCWGTAPDPDGDDILVDLDREKFWKLYAEAGTNL